MKLKFLFFLFLIPCHLHPQQSKIDSLIDVNKSYQLNDSIKVIHLINIFRQYARQNDLRLMKVYSDKAIEIAAKLPKTGLLTRVYEVLGRCYHGKAMFEQAISNYTVALQLATDGGDKSYQAGIHMNLSALYSIIPDYSKALESDQLAVKLYNELDDKENLASCYMNIGITYNDLNQPVNAVGYMKKALVIFRDDNEGFNYGASLAYQGIANSIMKAGDKELAAMEINPTSKFDKALSYLQDALKAAQYGKDAASLVGPVNADLGKLYENSGDNARALKFYKAALANSSPGQDKDSRADILLSLGRFYINNANPTLGKAYLFEGLAIGNQTGLLAKQQMALGAISKFYEKEGKSDSALLFYKQFITVRDSIFNQEKERKLRGNNFGWTFR